MVKSFFYIITEQGSYQPFDEYLMTAEVAGFQSFSQDNQKSGSIQTD
jgi:hypothetical protein